MDGKWDVNKKERDIFGVEFDLFYSIARVAGSLCFA